MAPSQHIAFKEWAAVCAALGAGRQSIILRKGGIHEGRDGFRVAHRQFWLYPTYVHQQADGLSEEGRPWLEQAQADRPPQGVLRIAHFVEVVEVYELQDAAVFPALADLHVWSQRTIAERFAYRAPGLFLLIVRVYRAPHAFELPESPHFVGCRSWVEFPSGLSTDGLRPVLSDAEFEHQRMSIRAATEPAAFA